SPTARSLTPSPSSTIVPAASCPSTSGGGSGIVPLVADRSLWHTPQAPILTITSPRFGDSTVTVSTTGGLFSSRQTTALPCLAMGILLAPVRDGPVRDGVRSRESSRNRRETVARRPRKAANRLRSEIAGELSALREPGPETGASLGEPRLACQNAEGARRRARDGDPTRPTAPPRRGAEAQRPRDMMPVRRRTSHADPRVPTRGRRPAGRARPPRRTR